MLTFITNYWRELILAILIFVRFILLLVQLIREPSWNKLTEVYNGIKEKLPVYIQLAEDAFAAEEKAGDRKLVFVLSMVKSYISKEYKFNNFEDIESLVISWIEDILACPAKK